MSFPTQTIATDVDGANVEHPTQVISNTPDTPVPTPPARSTEFAFTVEQIEKARREEREKVQREKQRLKDQMAQQTAELEELRQFREAQEAAKQAEERKKAKAEKSEAEKDMSAKEILARRELEWENRFTEQERRFQQMEAQSVLEREAMKLQVYIQKRVAEEQAQGNIAPQFVDYITGTSPEEVELSIEMAKVKTAEILAEVTSASRPRGVSVSAGPSSIGSQSEMESDEVDYRNLSLKDYLEKVRPKLGIGGGGQGLFS
jgi:hypothetical protein